MPVVCNVSNWRSDRLCGYAGLDLEVDPGELLASYAEHWLEAARTPRFCAIHFLRCALWFTEKHDREPGAGLLFLLDLFDHGFFADWQVFSDALEGFLRHHALGSNLAFLFGATVADQARINQGFAKLEKEHEGRSPDPVRLEPLIAALIDLTEDRAQRARQAETLDDWLIREAQVCGPARFLGNRYPAAESAQFGIATRSLLTRIEEMSADCRSSVHLSRQQAADALPPAWSLHRFKHLADRYRRRFPGEDWLEHLCVDHLLMPDRVVESIRQSGPEMFAREELPPQWRLPSERLALAHCIAHARAAASVLSADFAPRRIDAQIEAMGGPSASREARAAARRQLQQRELAWLIEEAMSIPEASEQGLLKLGQLRALYPWHPLPCRLMGIAAIGRHDLDVALDMLMKSVALQPDGFEQWTALARLAESRTSPEDGAALSAIARHVRGIARPASGGQGAPQAAPVVRHIE
jgi:hypothetical protein